MTAGRQHKKTTQLRGFLYLTLPHRKSFPQREKMPLGAFSHDYSARLQCKQTARPGVLFPVG